ncbi:MAG: DUF2452 domain-containing protein [Pseudomonadota bacterium]
MNDEPSNDKRRGLTTAGTRAVGAVTERNPDGKGVIAFLRDWDYSTPRGVVAKPRPQVMADYFTSLLVLSASMPFKPVFNKDYYLYTDGDAWQLSLISPDEWRSAQKQEQFVGTCQLHDDSTWSIEPSENLRDDGVVAAAVATFFDRFIESLSNDSPLEDGLPLCRFQLTYYPRLFAAALSRSVKTSLRYAGDLDVPATRWLEAVPTSANRLLGPAPSK